MQTEFEGHMYPVYLGVLKSEIVFPNLLKYIKNFPKLIDSFSADLAQILIYPNWPIKLVTKKKSMSRNPCYVTSTVLQGNILG